jgi:hypothetical protein
MKWSNLNSRRLLPTAMNDIRNRDSEGVEQNYYYYKVSFFVLESVRVLKLGVFLRKLN